MRAPNTQHTAHSTQRTQHTHRLEDGQAHDALVKVNDAIAVRVKGIKDGVHLSVIARHALLAAQQNEAQSNAASPPCTHTCIAHTETLYRKLAMNSALFNAG